jgi:4-amino-4-deoxy-L-arabinose transferase-like glycosyltransferase
VGSAILFLFFLGARDLWNPNEPIYGRAVVEMAERGDWLVPTVNGLTFGEKPILYFWLARIAGAVFGTIDEATLRLPCALAGVIGALLLYLLAQPFAGRTRARLAAALFATTYVIFWESRAVQMDILLTVTSLGAILAVARMAQRGFSPWLGWPLAGFAAGLGFLAKGPLGLICPAIAVLPWIVWKRRWNLLRPGPVLLGCLACVATFAPWFLWLWWSGEIDFLVEVLYRQNFTRFGDPWDHQNPWWYFLVYFWADFAPWAFFLPLALRRRDRDRDERDLESLCWIWIAAIVLFFSLSASKRSVYIMPAAPAVAILVAGLAQQYLEDSLEHRRVVGARSILAGLGLLFLAAGFYVRLVLVGDYPLVREVGSNLSLLLAGAGSATLVALIMMRRVRAAAPAALFSGIVCLYLLTSASVLPAVNVYKSARPFCERVNAEVGPVEPIVAYRQWKWRASYVYYSARKIPIIDSPRVLREYWARPERVHVLVEEDRLREVRALLDGAEPRFGRRIGSREVYLFSSKNHTRGE